MGLRSKKQKMPGRLDPADASLLLKYSLTLYWLVLTVTFRMFVYVVGTTCGGTGLGHITPCMHMHAYSMFPRFGGYGLMARIGAANAALDGERLFHQHTKLKAWRTRKNA